MYFGLAAIAAMLAPGDVVTATIALMIPLVLLYELGIFLAIMGTKGGRGSLTEGVLEAREEPQAGLIPGTEVLTGWRFVRFFLAVASARCQLTVWLWRYESAYMLRVSPRGYLVASHSGALASLGLAMMHKPTSGWVDFTGFGRAVVMMAMGTAVLKLGEFK